MAGVQHGAPQNDAADDNAVTATAKLLSDEGHTDMAQSTNQTSVEQEKLEDFLWEDLVGSHDEPVGVVGGDGEFMLIAPSGLPLEKDASEAQEFDIEKNRLEILTIARKLSLKPGRRSLTDTELIQRASVIVLKKQRGLQALSDAQKHAMGICFIMIHCLTIVGAIQFAKLTYSEDFSAPTLIVYYRTVCRIGVFPMFMVVKYIVRLIRQRSDPGPVSFWKTYTSCKPVFGPDGLTLKTFFYPVGLVSLWWVSVQICLTLAVKFLNNSIVSALFCSETAFCYILSAIVLKTPVYIIKVVAVVIALIGVSLTAYSQTVGGNDLRWEGVAICLGGAFTISGYMVAVKKMLGKTEDIGQSLLLTTVMSLFVAITCWPVVLGLYYYGVEYWNLDTFPWSFVNASSGMTLVSICVFNLCLTLTNPLLMTLSRLMGIPVNYVIDWIIYNHRFDVYQIVGVILIGFGFVFIALPERWLGIKILVQKLRRQTSTVPAAVTASATKTAAIKERAA